MALTLSNSGISSGSVIRAAEISQSIDAFTGTEAYDITLSGSFQEYGPVIISGSVTASGHVYSDRFFGAGVFDPGAGQSGFSSGQNLLNAFLDGPTIAQQWQITRTDIMKNTFLREGLQVFEGANITGSLTASVVSSSGDIKGLTFTGVDGTTNNLTASYAITASHALNGGGGTPAGSDTEIQFNNAGAFGASANFSFNSSTGLFAAPHGTFSTMSLAGGNYKFFQPNSENIHFNSDENAFFTKITGYDGNGDLTVGDGDLVYKGGALKVSGSTGASTIDISGSISASENGVTMRIDKNSIFSNRPNRMYIGNESTDSAAELMFVVGGTGTAANSSIQVNANQEISLGNPGTSFTYPLGFAAGELASFVQVTNNNAVSSSVLAIKGELNSDGILYVGSNNSRGGGMSFKGDATSPFGNLSNLNADNVELYRSDPSTAIAYPMLSYPTDVNRINLTSGTSANTLATPEFVQISSVPELSTNDSNNDYRRVYPVVAGTIPTGQTVTVADIPAAYAGIYTITTCFHGCEAGNMANSFSREDKHSFYNNGGPGSTPAQQGISLTILNVQAAGLNNAFLEGTTTDKIRFQITNNQALVTLNYAGYITVDFKREDL